MYGRPLLLEFQFRRRPRLLISAIKIGIRIKVKVYILLQLGNKANRKRGKSVNVFSRGKSVVSVVPEATPRGH